MYLCIALSPELPILTINNYMMWGKDKNATSQLRMFEYLGMYIWLVTYLDMVTQSLTTSTYWRNMLYKQKRLAKNDYLCMTNLQSSVTFAWFETFNTFVYELHNFTYKLYGFM